MTPKEYAKKKEAYADWLADQERRKRKRLERIQERQEEMESQEEPKVGRPTRCRPSRHG